MTTLELAALKFWNAAVFTRRAPERDQTTAKTILRRLAQDRETPPPVKHRAALIIIEGYAG